MQANPVPITLITSHYDLTTVQRATIRCHGLFDQALERRRTYSGHRARIIALARFRLASRREPGTEGKSRGAARSSTVPKKISIMRSPTRKTVLLPRSLAVPKFFTRSPTSIDRLEGSARSHEWSREVRHHRLKPPSLDCSIDPGINVQANAQQVIIALNKLCACSGRTADRV